MPGPGRFATWVNSIFSGRLLLSLFPLWSNIATYLCRHRDLQNSLFQCSERKGMAALSFSSISLKFQWSLRFCFLHESTRWLSNQPTSCERCQLSGDVQVSLGGFYSVHTTQPTPSCGSQVPDTIGRGLGQLAKGSNARGYFHFIDSCFFLLN